MAKEIIINNTRIKIKNSNASSNRQKPEKAVYGGAFILLLIYSIVLLFPVLWMLMSSFKGTFEFNMQLGGSGTFSLPKKLMFSNYVDAFKLMKVPTNSGEVGMLGMLINTVWFIFCTVGIGVFFSSLTGYVLSKYKFKGRNTIYTIVIVCMTIPIIGTTGAFYRLIGALGVYDTPLYCLVTAVNAWGFNFLICYGFFKNVSWSYAEAVFIDGGNHFVVFFKIMLPQAKGVLFVLSIMGIIAGWNDYTTPLLYMPSLPTLASGVYVLSESLLRFGKQPQYFAGLIITAIPILILYAIFSNKIMTNLSMGGLKG